jgi:Ca-activated chloride channel family protein
MNSLLDFHFIRPLWLLALPVLGLLLWQLWRRSLRPEGNWSQVIDTDLLSALGDSSPGVASKLPLWLLAVAWLLAVVALAGPSWEKLPQPVYQKQDALVILLDLSPSMYASDIEPSRLVQAQREIHDVLRLRNEGMTALVAYANDAHVVTPLTDDSATIALLLPTLQPGMMPSIGNQPLAALKLAAQLVANSPVQSARVLFVTDGIPAEDFPALEQLAASANLRLSILGIGTATGAPIPLSQGGFLKDSRGEMVVAGLNDAELSAWALGSPLRYQQSNVSDRDIEQLLQAGAAELSSEGIETVDVEQQFDTWLDTGPWLVLALLPLALLAFRRGWLLGLVAAGLVFPSQESYAFSWSDLWQTDDQQGFSLLQQGEAEQAAETFADPQWQAAARYRAGDYSGAAEAFANDDSSDGHYNRGNALARGGELEQALEAYDRSLELDPDNADAASNRELVESLIQQQQQQQSGDDQRQNPDQDQDQQQNQEQGKQQDQSGEGEQREQDSGDNKEDGDQQQNAGESAQQDADDPQQNPDNQTQQQPDGAGDEQQPPQEQAAEPGETSDEKARDQAEANSGDASEREADEQEERLQQWLRQIPDEPGDLLQRKFNYQYRQRQQRGGEQLEERY